MHSPTPVIEPRRDRRAEARAEKVRRLRALYLAGRLDEELIPRDADFSMLIADVLR